MGESPVDAIHLSWQPERADYSDAMAARNRSRKLWWFVGGGYVVAALAIAVGIALDGPVDLAFGVALAGFMTLQLALRPLAVRRLWTGTPYLQEARTAVLSQRNGYVSKTARSSARFEWPLFENCLETDRSFILQMRGRRKPFIVIPKRAYANPADLARGRAMMQQLQGGVRPI